MGCSTCGVACVCVYINGCIAGVVYLMLCSSCCICCVVCMVVYMCCCIGVVLDMVL